MDSNFVRFSKAPQKNLVSLIIVLIFIFQVASAFVSAQDRKAVKLEKSQISEAQKLLSDLGYWIANINGKKDASTYHAIVAFQKVERRKRTGVLKQSDIEAMKLASRPIPRYPGPAHIEIDIKRQVLFLVDDSGGVIRILPVSTGSEEKYFSEGKWQIAHTPRGYFKVTRQIFGVRRAPLGDLYYPNYFVNGVAIHGSLSIPFYPASHGCVRIPNFAAKEFIGLVSVGMGVFVYD